MKFSIYGPFDIPVDDLGRIVGQSELTRAFWGDRVEAVEPALPDASGCYIFCIRTSGTPRPLPWYVGRTNHQGFRRECFNSHQRNRYAYALGEYDKGAPQLFFIPRMTDSGKLSFAASSVIEELEYFFISHALARNERLLNKSDTAFFRDTIVPGFLNNEANPGKAAQRLKAALTG